MEIAADPVESAKAAGLRYVLDDRPGITRRRRGRRFQYLDREGETVTDERTLERIRSLAIPPAWTDVWICPSPRGHIQATGRDDRGRKQYRYHPDWREVRDATKYSRMIAFGEKLPAIRRRVDADMSSRRVTREKVLALVVRLLETTLIRVGNGEYARENGSVGLTTMRRKHVEVEGSKLRFEFRGKSGVEHEVEITDRRLARAVRRCYEIPGYELFKYVDEEGERQTIDSEDVNDYLREIAGEEFTAKDFRTWAGTVLATTALCRTGACETERDRKSAVVGVVEEVADRLGNTRSVCRKCYIHPSILEAYEDGSLLEAHEVFRHRRSRSPYALDAGEAFVVEFLKSVLTDRKAA